MNPRKTTIAILAALSASLALADDFKTINGKEYKNATVTRVEPDGIVIKFHGGIAKIFFVELPKDVQKRFGYDTDKIEAEQTAVRAAEAKGIEEQKAAEAKGIEEQKAAERELAAKEKNAEADLKRAVEQFQSAEQRAVRSYQSATKGILSGQVFVSTQGGESRKRGAVQVGLYARDAIDILIAELKIYADIKIRELSPSVNAAKAASDQAHGADYFSEAALKARNEYEKIRDERDSYYSGSFYFSYLQSPIQAVETDADGKFTMKTPKQGAFVMTAKSERYVGKTYVGEIGIDITEHYYWVQPVSLEGQQQLTQHLSNNNLTSTTGSSSLIHTAD